MKEIKMVDLYGQYQKIKIEIDKAIEGVLDSTAFINGPEVNLFQTSLQNYLKITHVIPCANGTDALQIALMALNPIKNGEIILPSFNYVATAEVISLLGFKPVFVDVDPHTFNIDVNKIEERISENTVGIMAVHLFGQCANLEEIIKIAQRYKLFLIEDNAQSIGANFIFKNEKILKAGTIGDIGTTSFFPSKNLGCMGDGGAIFTNNEEISQRIQMIANHGQKKKYNYETVGVNSRLDTLQAAILNVKLNKLDEYILARQQAAKFYDEALINLNEIQVPQRCAFSTHVFHQYTLKVKGLSRDRLQKELAIKGVPTMIYYPSPLHLHHPYKAYGYREGQFPVSEKLCHEVISLPMHTELEEDQLDYITSCVKEVLYKVK